MPDKRETFQKKEVGLVSADSDREFAQYIDAIRKRWPLAMAIVVTLLVLGGLYTSQAEKKYRASATIVITPRLPNVLKDVQEVMPVVAHGLRQEIFLRTEYKVLESRSVALRAAQRVRLRFDDQNNGLYKIEDKEERELARKKFDEVKYVRNRLKVIPGKRSQIVTLEITHTNPEFAAKLVNAVATSYLDFNVEKRISGTKDASTWLGAQYSDLKKQLHESEVVLYTFMEDHGVLNASLEGQKQEIRSRVTQFNTKLAEVQATVISERIKAETLKSIKEDPSLINSMPEVQSGEIINSLKGKLAVASAQLSELAQRYLPAHPRMRGLTEQIANLNANLDSELNAMLLGMDRKQRSLRSTERGLEAAIHTERLREAKMNKLGLEHAKLAREVRTNTRLYDMVTERLKEIDLTGMMQVNNVQILDYAEVPPIPFSPNLKKNMAVALILGLMLGLCLVLALDFMDASIKGPEDIANWLKASYLGVLPIIDTGEKTQKGFSSMSRLEQKDMIQARDLHILRNPKSVPAECSRAIRTNLLFMTPDKPLKSFAVTSAMPREGKTTTAVGLAVTMAQNGGKVLLVDTDLRKPRIHRSFDFINDVGVSNLILGEASIEEVVKKTEHPNLDVLVSGPIPPNPAEIFHTETFGKLVSDLEMRYDHVIYDASPIDMVTDPVVLGTRLDGVVLVVKTGSTPREVARESARKLYDARVELFGVILNDVDMAKKKYGYKKYYRYGRYYRGYNGSYYGSYYGGYYGGYGDEEEKDTKTVTA